MDPWALFLTPQFAVAAVAVAAVVTGLKRAIRLGWPHTLTRGWVKAVLSVGNLLAGALVAIPRFLPGDTYAGRLLLGLCAGLLSAFVYSAVLKRFVAPAPAVPPPVPQAQDPGA